MRARLVRPEFWSDSTVGAMSDSTRLIYVGLWCVADDAGYLEWDLDSIAMTLLGYRTPSVRRHVITAATEALLEAGRVRVLDCGRHAIIPTLPRYRIGGGRLNERVQAAHFAHGPVQVRAGNEQVRTSEVRAGTDTSVHESGSLSESLSESGSGSLSRRNGANVEKPGKRTTGLSHVSTLLPGLAAKGRP